MFVGLLPVKEDLKRIRAVRDAIGGGEVRLPFPRASLCSGPDMKLMVDANHAYTAGKSFALL